MLTGAILGLARAAGETAPILFTGAAFFIPDLPKTLFDQFMALPYHLYILSTQHQDIATVRPIAYGTALVLIGSGPYSEHGGGADPLSLPEESQNGSMMVSIGIDKKPTGGNGHPVKISVKDLNFYYGPQKALEDINMDIPANQVTAFIGPSGCGKSTFLRCFNRMNETILGTRIEGTILLDGATCTDRISMWWMCGAGWAWSSRNPILSRKPFLITWPTACASTG